MKVLFIGFGSIAKKHFQALKSLRSDCVFFALKSGNHSSDIPDITDLYSWEQIPSDTSFAIISNPSYKHTEALGKLIELSMPLFIEKPLSHRLEGLEIIENHIKQKQIISYVACNLRFLPVLQFLKNKLLPTLSKVQEVSVYCGSYLPNWRPGKDYKKIYSANKEMGGGVHLDLFHELDYTCWLFGMPQQSFSILRNQSSLQITAIDYAFYQFIYPDFVTAITLNYYRPDARRTIEIITEEDTFLINLLNNSITDSKGNSIFEAKDSAISDTYLEQMQFFLGIIEGINPPFNSFSESFEILKVCLKSEKVS